MQAVYPILNSRAEVMYAEDKSILIILFENWTTRISINGKGKLKNGLTYGKEPDAGNILDDSPSGL